MIFSTEKFVLLIEQVVHWIGQEKRKCLSMKSSIFNETKQSNYASINKLHIYCRTKMFSAGNCFCIFELFLRRRVNDRHSLYAATLRRNEAVLALVLILDLKIFIALERTSHLFVEGSWYMPS